MVPVYSRLLALLRLQIELAAVALKCRSDSGAIVAVESQRVGWLRFRFHLAYSETIARGVLQNISALRLSSYVGKDRCNSRFKRFVRDRRGEQLGLIVRFSWEEIPPCKTECLNALDSNRECAGRIVAAGLSSKSSKFPGSSNVRSDTESLVRRVGLL